MKEQSEEKQFRLRTFSLDCRLRHGESVGKIPLDCGIPCPNRKRGGCTFCAPVSFTPGYLHSTDSLEEQVRAGKQKLLRDRFRLYYAYYQQESCTAGPEDLLLRGFAERLADADCCGLIISTRPDCLNDSLLVRLAELIKTSGKECQIELGLQSVHEKSLRSLNRNHSFNDFHDAYRRIRQAGAFQLGAHLIFGIPGESQEEMLASVDRVCAMGIDSLKFHHLQVIRNTPLEEQYQRGDVSLWSMEGYREFLLRVIPRIPYRVVIHRLWSTSHPRQLVAPRWNVLPGVLSRELYLEMEEKNIFQGQHLEKSSFERD